MVRAGQAGENPVWFVGAGPGDPELITVRGKRLLEMADVVIYAGSLVNPVLVQGLKAQVHDSAGMHLDEIIGIIREAWEAGLRVVRLHTGDPGIYGAIGEQMRRLDALEIPCGVVPGVSSAFAAAASLKVELTVPEVTQTVIFTRQAGRTPVPPDESLERLAAARASMCIFLSAGNIEQVVKALLSGGYPEDTPVAVVARATWPDELVVRGSLADIAPRVMEAGIKKTAMILVGRAISKKPGPESRLYHRGFSHGCRRGND